MKRILLTVLSALTLGITATSCVKETHEVYLESSGTRVKEVTVKFNEWVQDDDGVNYVYCPVDWDILTDHVVYDGNVSVYLYEDGRQSPLPYVYPIGYITYDDGTGAFVAENLRYDLEVGRLTIIMQDLDGGKPVISRANTPDMTFRIVASAPINYIIEQ